MANMTRVVVSDEDPIPEHLDKIVKQTFIKLTKGARLEDIEGIVNASLKLLCVIINSYFPEDPELRREAVQSICDAIQLETLKSN